MQTRPEGHCAPASVLVHGSTQCASTHTLPPWHEALVEHADGLTSHTSRVKSHA
jgi:hypothetical protein